MGGPCSTNRAEEKCVYVIGEKARGKDRKGWCGLDWSGSGQEQVESSCEFGIEPLGSIKCWETIKWLNNWWLFE
jgi:hypothetical protein